MGAYVSSETCADYYGIEPNCTYSTNDNDTIIVAIAGNERGQFPADPDIAGIGVLGAFLCVTVTSLVLSAVSTMWWISKNIFQSSNKLTRDEKRQKEYKISIAGILETLIVTCSDQQVFTGGAYAICLRFSKACTVSAYHYNIVANILLITCATHLMAVTVAREYWKHPYVGALRITVTTLVYVITGILLANQGSDSWYFPTEVPKLTYKDSFLLFPAACFQTGDSHLGTEVKNSLGGGKSFEEFFTGQMHGWAEYLVMFLFYMIAVLVSLGRMIRRGLHYDGKRKRLVDRLRKVFPRLFRMKRVFYVFFGFYLVLGIAVCAWTVGSAGMYIFRLRLWMDKSGWIALNGTLNPENDPSTFGQLVPLLLMSLTVFTFLQIISERVRTRRKHIRRDSYDSLNGDRRGDGRGSPSPCNPRTTLSVVEVGSIHHNPTQERYDDPDAYPKSKPGVHVTVTEEESPSPQDIEMVSMHSERPRSRIRIVEQHYADDGHHGVYDDDGDDRSLLRENRRASQTTTVFNTGSPDLSKAQYPKGHKRSQESLPGLSSVGLGFEKIRQRPASAATVPAGYATGLRTQNEDDNEDQGRAHRASGSWLGRPRSRSPNPSSSPPDSLIPGQGQGQHPRHARSRSRGATPAGSLEEVEIRDLDGNRGLMLMAASPPMGFDREQEREKGRGWARSRKEMEDDEEGDGDLGERGGLIDENRRVF